MLNVICCMIYVICYMFCVNKLNTAKPTTYNNIPANILVEYSDVCSEPIHMLYNDSILNGTFPNPMKLADITPSQEK